MKVYAAPEGITLETDYSNYNPENERKKEDQYKADIKSLLVSEGYTGPLTGEIATFPVADGYAMYMYADAGRKSCLIHLAIGDAWNYQFIERLTKADIVQSINRNKNLKKLFGNH